MFIYQASASFKIWHGISPEINNDVIKLLEMIRIGILGDIGSGKSYVSTKFGYPVFDADKEVNKIYLKDKKVFKN